MSKPNEDQIAAREELKRMLPVGAVVYTILRKVSKDLQTRVISFVVVFDGEIRDLDWTIARAGLGKRHKSHKGLKVGGVGMDMGWAVVSRISTSLHGDIYGLKQSWL